MQRAPNAGLGLVVTLGLVAGQYASYTFITPFLAKADHAGPGVVSVLLLVFGIGGLIGNFGVVRLLSRRLKATVVGMAATLAVATAVMPVVGAWRPAAVVTLGVWGLAYGAMTVAMQTWVFTADDRDLGQGQRCIRRYSRRRSRSAPCWAASSSASSAIEGRSGPARCSRRSPCSDSGCSPARQRPAP